MTPTSRCVQEALLDCPAAGKLPDNYSPMSNPRRGGLLDLVSKHTLHPVKFEIQIKKYFLNIYQILSTEDTAVIETSTFSALRKLEF